MIHNISKLFQMFLIKLISYNNISNNFDNQKMFDTALF